MKKILLLYLLGMFLISPVFAQDHSYSFKEKYEMNDLPTMKIRTNDGFIEVYPSNSNTIEVFYIVTQRGKLLDISRSELEDKVDLEVIYNKNSLEIRVRNFRTSGWVDWRNRYDVSFEIRVPKEIDCNLISSDGDVRLKGVNGTQYCKTSDGDVQVSLIKGDLEAYTSDGDVFVEEVVGNVNMKTSDGDVKVRKVIGDVGMETSDGNITAYDIKGAFDAGTSDGDIRFDGIKGSVKATTSDGNIEGQIDELYSFLDVRTTDGDIDIEIPRNLGLDLNIRGERIYVQLGDNRMNYKDSNIRRTVNGGGIEVSLRTTDGKISLSER